jgi:signal peptidase I
MDKRIIYGLGMILLMTTVSASVTYNYQICGKSMYPAINKDTDCSVNKVIHVRASRVFINDTVCFNYDKRQFYTNAQYICHRVTDKNETHIETKGDSCSVSDGWTENKNVALKVLI